MNLIPLPAFTDNYIWLLHDGHKAIVVDPGDAQPVFNALQQTGLQLDAILVTHHHADHTGGVDTLREATGARVYGPARERIPPPLQTLRHGDTVQVLGFEFAVIDVPGHTAGHIAFYCAAAEGVGKVPGPVPLLFCGDTLFSGGCGRLFEGTPAQMLASLDALAALPGSTQVCCTHEYTLSNLKFARAVEPANAELIHYTQWCEEQRAQGQPTLPSSIARELQINPFLRTRLATISAWANERGADVRDEVAVFAAIRQWKNDFK